MSIKMFKRYGYSNGYKCIQFNIDLHMPCKQMFISVLYVLGLG